MLIKLFIMAFFVKKLSLILCATEIKKVETVPYFSTSEKNENFNKRTFNQKTTNFAKNIKKYSPTPLKTVLERTYTCNPDLKTLRQHIISINEKIAQAEGGWRPQIRFKSDFGFNGSSVSGNVKDTNPPSSLNYGGNQGSFGVFLEQNLYQGGRTVAQIKQTEAEIFANWASLYSKEQEILGAVIEAYIGAIASLKKIQNLEIYEKTLITSLQFADARFKAGDDTLTQVSEAQAKLSGARAELASEHLRYDAQIVTLWRLSGLKITNLEEIDSPNALPLKGNIPCFDKKCLDKKKEQEKSDKKSNIDIDKIIKRAERQNPSIMQSLFAYQSAKENIKVLDSELKPTIGLTFESKRNMSSSDTRVGHRKSESTNNTQNTTNHQVALNFSVPLYEGGITRSRVREGRDEALSKKMAIAQQKNDIYSQIKEQFIRYEWQTSLIGSYNEKIQANKERYENIMQEVIIGTKLLVYALDALLDMLRSQNELVDAFRDKTLSYYKMMQLMGGLDPKTLQLKVQEFNPKKHYDLTKKRY